LEMDLIAEETARAEQLKGRRLLCEIPFEKDDIDTLQQSLLPQGIEAWNHSPALTAMMTVGLGVYYYDRGDFWKPFPCINSPVDQSIWGKKFEGFLDHHYLETFRSIRDEGGHRYVAPILAHGGIPQTCLPDFFRLMTDSGDSEQSGHDLIDILKNSPTKLNLADQPIKRFLKYGGEVAEDFVSRFLALWQCYERGEMGANPGLPGRVVKEFSVWWPENRPTRRDNFKRMRKPDLRIEPDGCGVFLHLPRCDDHPDVGANGRWRALGQDWATTREHEIPLQPDIKWEVSIIRRTYTLIGATEESPILFFDTNTGKQIPEPSLRRLPTQVWALFSGDLQADPSPSRDESFLQWPGYHLAVFDLSNKHQLRVGSSTFDVRRPFFDYVDDPSVRGVRGRDGTQVFFSLPKIEWEGKANLSLTKDGVPQGNIDIESDELLVLLDKPGDYEIDLRGPLGESIHRHFLLIPGLTVQPSPEVMWPSQRYIEWHLSAKTGSVKSGDTLPPFTRYDSAVEFEVVYTDHEIGLLAEVPQLRWRLPYSQESGEWSNNTLPPVWLDDLKEANYPTLECNFGSQREDVAVTLVGRHSASEFEAKPRRSGDQSSWYFDLRRVRDELEAAGRSEEFELLIRSKNGTEYCREKVLSIRSRWHMENFFAEWKKVNEQHVINVSWREPDRPITGRWLVVIPLWKPWGGAVLQHPFDSAERNGYVWRLSLPDLQPGRYMVKAVHAPWGSDDWIAAQAVCQQAINVYPESWTESFGSQQMTPTVDFYLQALLAHWYRPQLVKKPPMPPVGLEEKDVLHFLDGLRLADDLEHIKIPRDGSSSLNIFCVNAMATTEAYKSLQQQPLAEVWTKVLPCPEIITLEPSKNDILFIKEVAFQYTNLQTAKHIKHYKQRQLSGVLVQWHKNLGKEYPPVDEVIFLCEKFRIFEHQSSACKRVYEQLKSEYQSQEAV
jgi:hypothetical protein